MFALTPEQIKVVKMNEARLLKLNYPNVNYYDLIEEPKPKDEDWDPEKEWIYFIDKNTKKIYAYDEFQEYEKEKWRECSKNEIKRVGYFNEYL